MHHRPHRISTSLRLALFVCGLIATPFPAMGQRHKQIGGCWDDSGYTSYANLDDSRTGIFAFTASRYRLRGDGGLWFAGGKPEYQENEIIIGAYDLESKQARLLYRASQRSKESRTALKVVSHAGTRLLLFVDNYAACSLPPGGPYYLFDAKSREMKSLPLNSDLAERGVTVGWARVVNGDGAILFQTVALEDRNTKWHQDDNIPMQLWVRCADGTYVHVATTRHWQGFRGDEVFYWMKDTRQSFAFEVSTRRTRQTDERERRGLRKEDGIREKSAGIYIHGESLIDSKKLPDGTWSRDPIPIEPSKLK